MMKVTNICKNYFNGIQDLINYQKNDVKTNVLTMVKILSYFTVIIPLGFIAAYGISSLYGRIIKKENISPEDKNIKDKAGFILLKKDPAPISSFMNLSNSELAEKIIAARGFDDKNVKAICIENFLNDPVDHLIHLMIRRGIGEANTDDDARAFVISRIPGFIEIASSPEYLRAFAEDYFQTSSHPNTIMQIFEESLKSEEFLQDLKYAVNKFNKAQEEDSFHLAEEALRIPLTIYYQSAVQQKYSHPEDAYLD